MATETVRDFGAFSIRRSARARRSRLTVTDAGEAVVVLPMRAPEADAHHLVTRHRRWIEKHQARVRDRRLALALRPSLANGRILTINGQAELVRAVTDAERASLDRRLRRAARAAIEARVAARSEQMDITPRRIAIRDQRTRWGSASRAGTLSFNWRLVLCPPDVLDYVVVHELAHLKIAGHGRNFWQLVDRYAADSREARRWLRDHHDEIRHALD